MRKNYFLEGLPQEHRMIYKKLLIWHIHKYFHLLSIARLLQVVKFGMSAKVGPLSFETPGRGEMAFDKPYSEATSQLIDQEVLFLG